jgi:protein tyrosine/serine phosphatase
MPVHRRWPPETAINFRDVGGVPTVDGGRIRTGVLYRSATPQFLSAADAAYLVAETRLSVVIDFRFTSEAEAEGSGGLAETAVRRLHLPIVGEGGDAIEKAVLAGRQSLLGHHYVSYVREHPDVFVDVFRTLASPGGTPALLHCAAGKDRTGVAVALVLSALGVADEAVIADYARTAEEMPRLLRRLAQTPTYGPSLADQDADDPMSKAHPESMRFFIDWVATEHGSAARWLLEAGLEPEALDALQVRLIERAAA